MYYNVYIGHGNVNFLRGLDVCVFLVCMVFASAALGLSCGVLLASFPGLSREGEGKGGLSLPLSRKAWERG